MPNAAEIVRRARTGSSVVGWKLERDCREELLEIVKPRYPNVVADHVTLRPLVARDTPLPDSVTGTVVGHADDGRGVQALVVEIDGSTDRPGGGTFHITWSLGPGRRAKESNDVLAQQPWQRLDKALPAVLRPALFP